MENSIEETKKQLELILKVRKEQKEIIECAGGSCINCDPDIKALSESIDILSDYKRVLKEVKRYKNMYEAEHQIHLVRNEQLDRKQKAIIKCNELENENKELKKENEKLKHKIEGQECVIEKQAHNEEVYEKLVMKLEKENEELKADRNNNYQMIALAQNEALGYMQGYEDGKKSRRSAIANIVENQQYYIFNKQMEKCKKYIKKLQKENKQLRTEVNGLKKGEVKYE